MTGSLFVGQLGSLLTSFVKILEVKSVESFGRYPWTRTVQPQQRVRRSCTFGGRSSDGRFDDFRKGRLIRLGFETISSADSLDIIELKALLPVLNRTRRD